MSGTKELFQQGGGGGGDSIPPLQLLPSKRPHPDSPPKSPPKNEVILVSFKVTRGPVGHALYAITVPIVDDVDVRRARPHSDNTIYPIIEIPSHQCPPSMCCVKVGSRLYYLGAETVDATYLMIPRPDVYFLDIDDALSLHHAAAAAANACDDSPPKPTLLKQGVPMIKGKNNCYAFEADGKIYALGTTPAPCFNQHQFEVFNPDTGEWTALPPPPFSYSPVTGHARIGHKVVITTLSSYDDFEELPYFDLHLLEWGEFYPKSNIRPIDPAVFSGGCLYFPYQSNIASLGPCEDGDDDLSDVFNNASFASPEVSELLDMKNSDYSSRLMHLGNSIFLYVMGISLPDPTERHLCDPDKAGLRVIVFEATGERLCEEELSYESESSEEEFCGGHKEPLFRTKLLSNSYFIRKSKRGTDANGIFIGGCFPTSMQIAG